VRLSKSDGGNDQTRYISEVIPKEDRYTLLKTRHVHTIE